MTSYEIAFVLAIGAVIGSTIFRTLIPITTKIMAEIQLSTKENRPPVIPKKLILRLDKNPKKTRKEQNTIKKIQEIRDTIQDSVLYAKLKKSIE